MERSLNKMAGFLGGYRRIGRQSQVFGGAIVESVKTFHGSNSHESFHESNFHESFDGSNFHESFDRSNFHGSFHESFHGLGSFHESISTDFNVLAP